LYMSGKQLSLVRRVRQVVWHAPSCQNSLADSSTSCDTDSFRPEAFFPFLLSSKFYVQPKRRHQNRTAVTVVSRIHDMLQSRRNINTAPNVCGVISLHDFFPAVPQRTITDQKSVASIGKIPLVILADRVAH